MNNRRNIAALIGVLMIVGCSSTTSGDDEPATTATSAPAPAEDDQADSSNAPADQTTNQEVDQESDPESDPASGDQDAESLVALSQAGAKMDEFPGDVDDTRLATFCGSATIEFDGDPAAVAPIYECLSEQAPAAGASAVFVSYTVEGDPIPGLWLVGPDTADIYSDNSQDAFGQPGWTTLSCGVTLPLTPPANGFPIAFDTFDC